MKATPLTQTRIISQIFFFALFLFFAMVADLRYLKGYPVSLFLEIDPLVAFANALSVHEIYMGLLWSLVIIIPTLLLGRFFCGWVCPYGTLHHFVGWLFNRRSRRQKVEVNRYRPMYRVKYLILAAMLVAAVFGSLQIGLLDPICLFTRSMAAALAPGVNQLFPGTIYIEQHDYTGAWVIGWMLVFLVAMNVAIPRWFCRTLCPLGALMGVLSRLSLWRIERDPHTCTHCNQCAAHCEGACDPHLDLRKAECFVCFNCVEDCPPTRWLSASCPAGPTSFRARKCPRAGPSWRAWAVCSFMRGGAPRARSAPISVQKQSARRRGGRARVPRPLPQVRRVLARLPNWSSATGGHPGRRGGLLDTDP